MTAADDLLLVVRLAALVEDRDREEQRALLRTAVRLERDLNSSTTRNMRARWGQRPCVLVDEVEDGQSVRLSTADRRKVDARRERFYSACREFGLDWPTKVLGPPPPGAVLHIDDLVGVRLLQEGR